MPHGDAVINCNGIEFSCEETMFPDFFLNDLANVVKMDMSRNELGTMAMTGFPKCSSFMPLARQRLLAPAMFLPVTVIALLS
jgi:hypothetical protein